MAGGNIYYVAFLMKNKQKPETKKKKKLKSYNKLKQPVVIFYVHYNSFKFRIKSRKALSERNVFTIKVHYQLSVN